MRGAAQRGHPSALGAHHRPWSRQRASDSAHHPSLPHQRRPVPAGEEHLPVARVDHGARRALALGGGGLAPRLHHLRMRPAGHLCRTPLRYRSHPLQGVPRLLCSNGHVLHLRYAAGVMPRRGLLRSLHSLVPGGAYPDHLRHLALPQRVGRAVAARARLGLVDPRRRARQAPLSSRPPTPPAPHLPRAAHLLHVPRGASARLELGLVQSVLARSTRALPRADRRMALRPVGGELRDSFWPDAAGAAHGRARELLHALLPLAARRPHRRSARHRRRAGDAAQERGTAAVGAAETRGTDARACYMHPHASSRSADDRVEELELCGH
mmetsp:Transcript_37044/g.81381  ORF Transcript_37044/g.81381 Transcript_37044/m.81381 type:complete len:325 (+) Transcript_37044:159-1133(+)